MSLGQNIYHLRKKNGITQEQLAELTSVTRQTISNWELDSTSPNPEQLKSLSTIFDISVDELIDNAYEKKMRSSKEYEYISKKKIKGIPLVHIHLGLGHGFKKAKGIIAIGNQAKGVVALGGIAIGIFSLGGISLGLLALGGLALGLLLSIGGLSIGSVALGGIAIGLLAIGGVAIGLYSIGGLSVAKYIASGDYATGTVAIGNHVKGTIELIYGRVTTSEIKNAILSQFPNTWNIIVSIFSNIRY